MPMQVCTGAQMMCTCGMAPSTFIATTAAPQPVMTSGMLAGTIMDFIPFVNILPFGMCISPANPMVAAATAAAFGVLTPMPCLPMTVAPWVAGAPNVLIDGVPALDDVSKLTCNWTGVISFVTPGQLTHQIP